MRKGFNHGGNALSAQALRVLRDNHDQFVSVSEILEDPVVQATSVVSSFLRRKRPDRKGAEKAVQRAISYIRREGRVITSLREGGVTRYCYVE